jgi:hypothetical protein
MEHIDPMTGNLPLTFTDLVLPGNAGFDLKIQRIYNSKITQYLSSTKTRVVNFAYETAVARKNLGGTMKNLTACSSKQSTSTGRRRCRMRWRG